MRTHTSVLERLGGWAARESHLALLLLVAAVLLAAGLQAALLGTQLRFPDESDYVALAERLARDGTYALADGKPTAYRPPGYPFLMATVAKAGGGVACFRWLNVLASAGTVLLLYRLARQAGGSAAAGLLAAGMGAVYPLSFYTAGTLYPQTVATALLLGVLCIHGPAVSPSWPRAWLSGGLLGYLILTVPTFLVAAVVLAAWDLRRSRGRAWPRVLALACAAALVLAPWTLRNLRVLHGWVPVATNGGLNLLLGNSNNTTPSAGVNVDIREHTLAVADLDEVAQDRAYTRAVLAWMGRHPARAARLYAAKFVHHFGVRDELYTQAQTRDWQALLVAASYWPLLAVVGWRLARRRRRPLAPLETLVLLLYLAQAAFQALYFTRLRFRVPLDPLLMIPAALALTGWGAGPARPAGRAREPDAAGAGG